jgi:hypothetical protein
MEKFIKLKKDNFKEEGYLHEKTFLKGVNFFEKSLCQKGGKQKELDKICCTVQYIT